MDHRRVALAPPLVLGGPLELGLDLEGALSVCPKTTGGGTTNGTMTTMIGGGTTIGTVTTMTGGGATATR